MRVTFIQQLHRLPFRIRNFSGIDRKDNDLRHRFRASASGFPYTPALIFQILHGSRPAARPTGSRPHLLPAPSREWLQASFSTATRSHPSPCTSRRTCVAQASLSTGSRSHLLPAGKTKNGARRPRFPVPARLRSERVLHAQRVVRNVAGAIGIDVHVTQVSQRALAEAMCTHDLYSGVSTLLLAAGGTAIVSSLVLPSLPCP